MKSEEDEKEDPYTQRRSRYDQREPTNQQGARGPGPSDGNGSKQGMQGRGTGVNGETRAGRGAPASWQIALKPKISITKVQYSKTLTNQSTVFNPIPLGILYSSTHVRHCLSNLHLVSTSCGKKTFCVRHASKPNQDDSSILVT